jgi:hypothetical protein
VKIICVSINNAQIIMNVEMLKEDYVKMWELTVNVALQHVTAIQIVSLDGNAMVEVA